MLLLLIVLGVDSIFSAWQIVVQRLQMGKVRLILVHVGTTATPSRTYGMPVKLTSANILGSCTAYELFLTQL